MGTYCDGGISAYKIQRHPSSFGSIGAYVVLGVGARLVLLRLAIALVAFNVVSVLETSVGTICTNSGRKFDNEMFTMMILF